MRKTSTPSIDSGYEKNRLFSLPRAAVVAALLSSVMPACSSPQTQATTAPSSKKENMSFLTPKMTPTDSQTEFIPFDNSAGVAFSKEKKSSEAEHGPVIQTPEVIVIGKAPGSPWPKLHKDCVYTGIILEHDTETQPHYVVLENMCLRGKNSPTKGYHVVVQADENECYDLPFHDSHLEEHRGKLFFVNETRERIYREVLRPESFEPGVYSFQNFLRTYGIRDIK